MRLEDPSECPEVVPEETSEKNKSKKTELFQRRARFPQQTEKNTETDEKHGNGGNQRKRVKQIVFGDLFLNRRHILLRFLYNPKTPKKALSQRKINVN